MIYLVTKNTNSEGYEVFRAFTNRNDADALVESFEAYDKEEPIFTTGHFLDQQTPDVQAAFMAWQAGHPAGYSADSYSVIAVPVNDEEGEAEKNYSL
ncbi:hypothetical protein V2K54_25930 [Pseudomonas alliivorans]|nr:hypothetical protein [Pseudomonas alliivorans]